jgi:hypothetical protein
MARTKTREEGCYVHQHGVEAMFDKVKGDIDRDGFSIVGVMDTPPFSYTVGLTQSRHHPEIVITGLDLQTGRALLHAIVERIPAAVRLPIDEPIEKIANFPLVLKPVPRETSKVANMARALYEQNFELLQLVWPDAKGRFPWENGHIDKLTQPRYWRA